MPKIIPITDLRNTTEISKVCHETKEPVFITKNGYGDMVIMSIEAYEALTEDKAESDPIDAGEDARETLAGIRRRQA